MSHCSSVGGLNAKSSNAPLHWACGTIIPPSFSGGRPPLLSGLVAWAACLVAKPWLSLVSYPVLRLALAAMLLFAVVLLFALGQKAFYLEIFRRLIHCPVEERCAAMREGRFNA